MLNFKNTSNLVKQIRYFSIVIERFGVKFVRVFSSSISALKER